jgi:glucose-1-phosphate cytidylyltransferase
MKIVLLAGGLGTRLREETEFRPKPMVPVGGKPILWHIMKTFAHYGHQEFIVCAGYRGDYIRQYFHDFEAMNTDFTVHIGQQIEKSTHGVLEESGWVVTVAETGAETMTGGRILRVKDYVGNETFMCTYGDGLANVDIAKLLAFHKSHGKPQSEGWINAGYFVFEPQVFDYLETNSILEREPLTKLAREGQLMAFKHEGFFQPMDTLREMMMLNEMWDSNKAPWKVWK